MRSARIFVILAVATLAFAQSPEEEEYQRKLKDYEEKKAVYDRHQAVANVPIAASNDLVPKVPVDQIPPGYAEQLLPTYTGIPVQFNVFDGPVPVPEIVPEVQTVSPLAVTPPAVTPPAVTPTPLRPGAQFFTDKRPAPSTTVNVQANIRPPSRPAVATKATVAPVPRRPPGLFVFSNARVSLPNLAQRFGFGAAPARVQ